MRPQLFAAAVLVTVAAMPGTAFQKSNAPETFTANLHAVGASGGAAAATIQIHVDRYTPEQPRTAVASALKTGGYPAFLTELRKAPEVGTVSFGEKKWSIRWAREQTTPAGRTLVFVTDQPMHFVGGGAVDAKPREGYEVAVIQLQIDGSGLGNGSMAAAARVKPDGDRGVQIDDYADKPIKLVTVVRKI